MKATNFKPGFLNSVQVNSKNLFFERKFQTIVNYRFCSLFYYLVGLVFILFKYLEYFYCKILIIGENCGGDNIQIKWIVLILNSFSFSKLKNYINFSFIFENFTIEYILKIDSNEIRLNAYV